MQDHEIGKIPGIGFKISQKLRAHVLGRQAAFDTGLVYGGTKEHVSVRDVLNHPRMSPDALERLLGGSGAPHGIGARVWHLLNGCDSAEVSQARQVPTQISIEDSYVRLVTLGEVAKELHNLATSLLRRMHTDLVEDQGEDEQASEPSPITNSVSIRRWLAHPKTIRLSTRPRPPQNLDGSRNRSFARTSRSAPMPTFIFSLTNDVETIVERLVNETLLPLFRCLHPGKSGWNLSLVNIAAVNMTNSARNKGGVGRNIAIMFRQQEDVLRQWKVEETGEGTVGKEQELHLVQLQPVLQTSDSKSGSEDIFTSSQQANARMDYHWKTVDEEMVEADFYQCEYCGATMPWFAMGAHERFHMSKRT
jgi:DNA polymerase iota